MKNQQKVLWILYLSLSVVTPVLVSVFDNLSMQYNEDYINGEGAAFKETKYITLKLVFLGVISAILFANGIIISVAIFEINKLVKKTQARSCIQINTNQLALHTFVTFLLAICAIPCCILVKDFYGPYY